MKNKLKAALGKVNITPEENVSLQGYDPEEYTIDPIENTLDPLYARILVLDNDQKRVVIVSIDSCLTNEEITRVPDPSGKSGQNRIFVNTFPFGTRKVWAQAAGIAESDITVNATHTHSAPTFYSEKYTSRVSEKIKQIIDRLVPVKLSFGSGDISISANRRPHLKPNFSIPIDHSLNVIMIESLEGKPLGAIVNCAVHPTMLWKPDRISSEMVGLAMGKLEQKFGDRFISLFLQGFSGDICPITGGYNEKGKDTYRLVKEKGNQLYTEVLKCIENTHEIVPNILLSKQKVVRLPTKEEFHEPHKELKIMAIRIGEVAIVSVSGEVFNGYIKKLANHSPFNHVVYSGLANGYSGYFPTYQAFHDGLGGYELNTTPFTDRVEGIFLTEMLDLLLDIGK